MTVHTPGPWSAKIHQHHPGADNHIVVSHNGYTIATQIYHSNVSLIAAAPELLDMCQELIKRHPGGEKESLCHKDICTMEQCSTCGIVLKARAIIAKAKGCGSVGAYSQ